MPAKKTTDVDAAADTTPPAADAVPPVDATVPAADPAVVPDEKPAKSKAKSKPAVQEPAPKTSGDPEVGDKVVLQRRMPDGVQEESTTIVEVKSTTHVNVLVIREGLEVTVENVQFNGLGFRNEEGWIWPSVK